MKSPSFTLKLFHGELNLKLIIHSPTTGKLKKEKRRDAYLVKRLKVLRENLNPMRSINRPYLIKVYKGFTIMGTFALKYLKNTVVKV